MTHKLAASNCSALVFPRSIHAKMEHKVTKPFPRAPRPSREYDLDLLQRRLGNLEHSQSYASWACRDIQDAEVCRYVVDGVPRDAGPTGEGPSITDDNNSEGALSLSLAAASWQTWLGFMVSTFWIKVSGLGV